MVKVNYILKQIQYIALITSIFIVI